VTYIPIERVEIESYGCIQNASFTLTPLHALIGPNDSGKSTVLQAIHAGTLWLSKKHGGNNLSVSRVQKGTCISFSYSDDYRYHVRLKDDPQGILEYKNSVVAKQIGNAISFSSSRSKADRSEAQELMAIFNDRLSRPTMIRFDPDSLRQPAALIPDHQGIVFADERGAGLASVFDAIVNRDTDAFMAIQAEVRSLFPSVSKIGLINVSKSAKEIAATLVDGTRVGAREMSEGLLYYLGFAALKYLDGTRLFLVEEPENGLYPARIAEVMRSLREISKTSQVIIATHSPLVVNELEGDEVTVVTRPLETGTQAILLKDVPGYDAAAKVYQPGEFWVSYCDGDQETPLLTGTARK
jgi:predicted ATPase